MSRVMTLDDADDATLARRRGRFNRRHRRLGALLPDALAVLLVEDMAAHEALLNAAQFASLLLSQLRQDIRQGLLSQLPERERRAIERGDDWLGDALDACAENGSWEQLEDVAA